MVESEENAHKAGKDFAQQMDRIARIEEDKRSQFWHDMKSNLASSDVESLSRPLTNESPKNLSSLRLDQQKPSAQNLMDKLSNKVNSYSRDKASFMVPKILRNDGKDTVGVDGLHREAVHFMRGIMDECTHLKNYDVPYDPSLIYIVVAENDAYQPRDGIAALPDIWPGANITYIEGKGHVSSYLWKQDVFRQAIYNCIDSYVDKYMQQS